MFYAETSKRINNEKSYEKWVHSFWACPFMSEQRRKQRPRVPARAKQPGEVAQQIKEALFATSLTDFQTLPPPQLLRDHFPKSPMICWSSMVIPPQLCPVTSC
jgi:hypothetical protein